MNNNNKIGPGVSILAEDDGNEPTAMMQGGGYPQGGVTAVTEPPVGGMGNYGGYPPMGPGVTAPMVPGVTGPTEPEWNQMPPGGMPPTPPIGGGVTGTTDPGWPIGPGTDEGSDPTEMDMTCCVGWLMVVTGPERGIGKELHSCWNDVGRSEEADVILRGDASISKLQVRVNYVEEFNRYYILPHPKSSKNTMVNGEPLLQQQELKHGDIINMSKTTQLRFIPACDAKFVWCASGEEKSWREWDESN